MALLQALFSMLMKSSGKALNAIFGWAVVALFGQTSATEKTVLSGLVAAAAVWPLLVVGTIFPKAALLVIAFVPLAKSVPTLWLRLVWLVLTLAVPIVVGIVVAKKSPPGALVEPTWKKLLRGFPITLSLACAFFLMFVIAPCLKVAAALKGHQIVHVPALLTPALQGEVTDALVEDLASEGVLLHRADPPWHMTAASRVLRKLGGKAFSSYVPTNIQYRRGDDLDLSLSTNELLLRGKKTQVAKAHGLASEVFGPRQVLETFDPAAQALEKQIKRVWSVFAENPERHRNALTLRARVDAISHELSASVLPFDEYQIVYRELLQLDRALRGEESLLAHPQITAGDYPAPEEEVDMPSQRSLPAALAAQPRAGESVPVSVEAMSNRQLVGHVTESVVLLAKKEIELAKAEIRGDLKNEIAMAKGLGVAGLCALLTTNLLLVAIVLGLGNVMAEWGAALLVAGVVLAVGTVAGLVGWGKRVKDPLSATRRTLKEDLQWAKERIA